MKDKRLRSLGRRSRLKGEGKSSLYNIVCCRLHNFLLRYLCRLLKRALVLSLAGVICPCAITCGSGGYIYNIDQPIIEGITGVFRHSTNRERKDDKKMGGKRIGAFYRSIPEKGSWTSVAEKMGMALTQRPETSKQLMRGIMHKLMYLRLYSSSSNGFLSWMHEQVDTNPIYKPNRPEEGKSKHDPKPKLTSCSN